MLLSLLLSIASCQADTLIVDHAMLDGSCPIVKAYTTDSLNMEGKTLDIAEVLSQNESIARRMPQQANSMNRVLHGEALTVGADSLPMLRALRFTIQSQRFAKGRIEIKHLHNYKLFVNGKECREGDFSLAPGRINATLLVLTQKSDRDTFDVKITGKDLSAIQLNATGKHPFSLADMTLGDHYSNVKISPSGKYLVTISNFLQPDGKKQYTTILSEIESGRELMHLNEYVSLNWLKSQRNVLFYTRKGGRGNELVVYTPDDGKENVLAYDLPNENFDISPNEDYLIFSKSEEGKKSTGSLKRLQEPDDRQPGWRSRNSLWRYDLKSGVMQRLTFGSESIWVADISADGKKLLLQYTRFKANSEPFYRTTFVSMDAYTAKVDTLLADTAYVNTAQYSPDGSQLLISASPASFGGIGSEVKQGQVPNSFDYRLYLYDIASHTTTPLLRNFNPSIEDFEWARGDGKVYFSATDGSDLNIFSLDVTKKKVTRYELPLTYVSRYSIASLMRSPRIVFFGQTSERAREMFVAQLNTPRPTANRIGSISFDEIYKDVAIGKCQTWRFKASRGDSIDGFFFLPPEFDATKKYPLIVYYYGGCTPTSRCLEFHYPLQILASQGYVVYVPNPSGAIGYGQEFAARHVNTWGKESGDDIIEGTQAFCREHPYVDEKRVGCMGASYGGFMTEYLQTRTDIFAAAIAHAGISNITSYWGGGYWGYSYGECAQYGSYPWNNPDLYVKQSPLFNADKIHTPLLLLHGTADTNVPTTESQQLFTALKILGREVSYVQVDGENHIIMDYQKRVAWQNVIFAWFAKYLQKDSTWWDSLNL